MGKEVIVEIKGGKYRYEYDPSTKKMVYKGPVGDAPPVVTEAELEAMCKAMTDPYITEDLSDDIREGIHAFGDIHGIPDEPARWTSHFMDGDDTAALIRAVVPTRYVRFAGNFNSEDVAKFITPPRGPRTRYEYAFGKDPTVSLRVKGFKSKSEMLKFVNLAKKNINLEDITLTRTIRLGLGGKEKRRYWIASDDPIPGVRTEKDIMGKIDEDDVIRIHWGSTPK